MIYYRIVDGVAEAAQEDITGFPGLWVLEEEGFGVGDLYDGTTWSHPAVIPLTEAEQRTWRDGELTNYDLISLLLDHPQHTAIVAYRQSLRDWPTTTDFPATRPIL